MIYIRSLLFLFGLCVFSLGIAITIKVDYLGLHPWDVLGVALYEQIGFSIGTWNILIGVVLIIIAFILDKSYIKIGTFLNAMIIGVMLDIYFSLGFLPEASHTWLDVVMIITGIIIMGVGGGLYNAARIGSGPRDGFMLSLSDKTGLSVGLERIITELTVLLISWLIGGTIFIFTFIFTFVQSPIFQFVYLRLSRVVDRYDEQLKARKFQRESVPKAK